MKVTYIDHMGDDLSVVNAAKVSFGKRSEWEPAGAVDDPWSHTKLSKKDQGLIQFLARGCTSGDWDALVDKFPFICTAHKEYDTDIECWTDYDELQELLSYIRKMPSHWSPFAHTAITLHLKMPIFVARQIMKHTTGIEYNEVSRRYVDSEPEFYVPDVWRKKADNVKQGSSDEAVDSNSLSWTCPEDEMHGVYQKARDAYRELVHYCQVAPEQARMVLPQSMYTEVIATGNLWAICNLITQRTDSHAQKETQDLAKQIEDIVRPLFPVSTDAILGRKS